MPHVVLVQDIHAAFLGYLGGLTSGSTRAAAISGVLARLPVSGATQGQVGNYVNAAASGAANIGATDSPTYNAFDNRFQALGVARGVQMADAAGLRGIAVYLLAEDVARHVERLQEKRDEVVSGDIPGIQAAQVEVAAASGLTAATRAYADRGLTLYLRERRAARDMLDAAIREQQERLG